MKIKHKDQRACIIAYAWACAWYCLGFLRSRDKLFRTCQLNISEQMCRLYHDIVDEFGPGTEQNCRLYLAHILLVQSFSTINDRSFIQGATVVYITTQNNSNSAIFALQLWLSNQSSNDPKEACAHIVEPNIPTTTLQFLRHHTTL